MSPSRLKRYLLLLLTESGGEMSRDALVDELVARQDKYSVPYCYLMIALYPLTSRHFRLR